MPLVEGNRKDAGDGSVRIFWCVCIRDVVVISGGAMWMSMYGHAFSSTYL